MLIAKMVIFHYLTSFCQSHHVEYPLANNEKRMPRLPILKDIGAFLDTFDLDQPHQNYIKQKQERASNGAEIGSDDNY